MGLALALLPGSPDQAWPYLAAQPTVYDPGQGGEHRVLGRCATLTDESLVTGGPAPNGNQQPLLKRLDEVSPPPTEPVCQSSWLYQYTLQVEGLTCGGASYTLTGNASASPLDGSAAPSVAALDAELQC